MSAPTGIDASFAGRSYPATRPYEVGREELREFAETVGASQPAHSDVVAARALGYADVVAPPTYAVKVAQLADRQFVTDPAAGIDYSRVVHGEQSFTHHRPIVAGDSLVAVLHVDSVRVVRGNAMVTTRNEISTVDGEPVSTVVSMLVVRADG
ncbi:MaoC family dehydratase N-terminal domain-containing protein [Kineococcus sp. NUM-3379]